MDSLEKLELLTKQADFDLEDEKNPGTPRRSTPPCGIPPIFHAKKSGGGEIPLLKTMLTTACERNCYYCPFRAGRAGRHIRRETLKPEEMAKLFYRMYRGGLVEGIFLSSGIIGGGTKTQDRIIATAEILRKKYDFRGYVHLKLMPGAEEAQVERTMQLASRVSINLEAPNPERLAALAPKKDFIRELLGGLRTMEKIRIKNYDESGYNRRFPSLATQFVVGGVGDTDLELLSTSTYLLQQLNLTRVYYSAFNPLIDTPMENLPAENPSRKLRLYQASFLIRDYGFGVEDFSYNPSGNLPLDTDPKLSWAKENLTYNPIEINKADRVQLLRIPGIGPKGVERILQGRLIHAFRELGELHSMGIVSERAAPFILLDGKRPTRQPSLW